MIPAQATGSAACLPARVALHPTYPIPCNPEITIGVALPKATRVRLVVYDRWGREVSRLIDGYLGAGHSHVVWDGKATNGNKAPSGIYIVRMATPEFTSSIKIVLMK